MDPLLLGLAALGGVATILSPCILPILPILVGRALQTHRYGPLALVGGLAVSFALTGSLLGLSAEFIGPLSSLLRQIAIFILLILGLAAVFPQITQRFTAWIQPLRAASDQYIDHQQAGLWAEFLIGTQLGLVWVPCAGPILGSIFTLIAVEQEAITGFWALLSYAVGAGIPMLALAYGGKGLLLRVRKFYPHTALVQRISGMGIALAAVAVLLGWDTQIQLLLAPLFPSPLI